MAVIPIRVIPDPVLRRKARRIRHIDGSVHKLIGDMLETLHAAPGAGLAAPQVGVSLRLAIINVPGAEDITLINPEVVRRRGERLVDEGCLSVPGYVGQIKRAESVTVKAQDQQGKDIRIKADGLLAQALSEKGGELVHLQVSRARPVGRFHALEPGMGVLQWRAMKP